MKTLQNPLNLEVLLHYHISSTVHPRIDADAVAYATRILLQSGCIEPALGSRIDSELDATERPYRTTPKGKAWVKCLCNMEAPREVYVDNNGNII